MNIRARNFTIKEICHRPTPAALLPAGYFLMGVIQCIRDRLCIKFKRDVRIIPTSGYRSPEVNDATPGAAANSNHEWSISRQTGLIERVAGDYTVVGCTLEELYIEARQSVRGEVYINYDSQCVHIAPCGPIKAPFRKKNGRYY